MSSGEYQQVGLIGYETRRLVLTHPVAILPTDRSTVENNQLVIRRGTTIIHQQPLTGQSDFGQGSVPSPRTITEMWIQEPVVMPGINVTVTRVAENQNTGAVTFYFSDGENNEFANWDAIGEIANGVDGTGDVARRILMCKSYRQSPDGANKTNQVGASCGINGLADVPVVYTEPQ